MRHVYERITERIISALEQGTVPWHRSWHGIPPSNLSTRKAYRGINALVLSVTEYRSPYWITFRQARGRGGAVRKGEHGSPCVFWNWQSKIDSSSGREQRVPFLRNYTVFNLEQCSGLSAPDPPRDDGDPGLPRCREILERMPNRPTVLYGGDQPSYCPGLDEIRIPYEESFERSEHFFSTMFHEIIHATGHAKRLDRPLVHSSESSGYAKEELIAEIGASFLCGQAGIECKALDDSASYIAGWLKSLEKDSRLVVHAAGQAQRAADYVLNRSETYDAARAGE